MPDDFEESLNSHFDDIQKKNAASNAKLQKQYDEEALFLSDFDAKYKMVIQPLFEKARDTLLKRNLPAEVVEDKDDSRGGANRIYRLHCSDDIKDLKILRKEPLLRLHFLAEKKTIVYSASSFLINGNRTSVSHVPILLSEITDEKIKLIISTFIKAGFPA